MSPEKRQKYVSVNEQNYLIINKVKDFRDNQPALSSPYIDWVEFSNDFDTGAYIQAIVQRLQSMEQGLSNAKILHDWDNYQASLTDYDYTTYKKNTSAAGYETKHNELKQFFSRTNTASTNNNTTNTATQP